VGTRLAARAFRLRRGIAIAAGLAAVSGLIAYSGAAGAAPKPTLSQVRQQINKLTSQSDQVGQQLDQVTQQLSAASSKLTAVRVEAARDQARFQTMRHKVAQLAAASFEDSAMTSVAGLLASGNPTAALNQASLLQQQAGRRNDQVNVFLADTRQLSSVQQELQRTQDGIAALKAQLAAHKQAISKLLATQQATLDSLTQQQQTQVAAGAIGAAGTTSATYSGPTNTQAGQAVAFAYAQLGKPYVWGATGPGSYDCSGLVQAAWASAGVSLPRVTYDQWAALPHISASVLEPGDLLFFDGEGHVSMYVGGGYMIDAPRTGLTVQKVPTGTAWYAASFDGAVRP
jgi:cell wall-associated NlpC family hydrolase